MREEIEVLLWLWCSTGVHSRKVSLPYIETRSQPEQRVVTIAGENKPSKLQSAGSIYKPDQRKSSQHDLRRLRRPGSTGDEAIFLLAPVTTAFAETVTLYVCLPQNCDL